MEYSGVMKQITSTPQNTTLAIRISNNCNGISDTTSSTGLTYVVKQPQQSKVGVLRPVSFVPQLQQINGGCNNSIGGKGGQVVIRRFPNNNVVHVRRIISQKHQPQQQQKKFQKVIANQSPPGGSELISAAVNFNFPQCRQQVPMSVITESGKNVQGTSSEPESDEYEANSKELVHATGSYCSKNGTNNANGDSSDNADRYGNESECGHHSYKLLISGKRKRVVDDDGETNGNDGDLPTDQVENDESQEGDIIDHDGGGEDNNEKSALELNGACVDNEFLKHVVETQILNRHKTRIKDWDGTRGHMCQSCHETFLSESGLEIHRNRRIHHIFFFCRHCKHDLSFFNKCRLLQHLRNHRATPTVSSLQNCIMIRLLPESDYLHFKYEDCTSSSDDEQEIKTSSPLSTGGGNSSCNGSGGLHKRIKPSRFRRIARSSLTGRDSDNSPPPNVSRQIVAPPQMSSPPLLTENSTTTIVSTLNNANACNMNVTTTVKNTSEVNKFGNASNQSCFGTVGASAPREDSDQLQVGIIESIGSFIQSNLPSSNITSIDIEREPCEDVDSSTSPQIRIRNLSLITASVNDEDDDEHFDKFEGEDEGEGKLDIAPVIQPQLTSHVKSSVAVAMSEKSTTTHPSVIVTSKEYRCYKCDRFYVCAYDLFKHLEEAEQIGLTSRSLHRCPTDDIPSWSQCQYVFHTKVFHEKSVPFICPGCGEESLDYNKLLEHVTNDCFYLSQRARYMCAATVSKCSFSDRKSVKTEPEIIDHLKKEHSRSVLQCLHCTQGFATDNWLLKHLSEAHGVQLIESQAESEREALINKTTRPLTQCLICNILFPNGSTYLQHVYLNFHMHILHAKMLECQNCFEIFETRDEILAHRKKNEACRKIDPFLTKISEGTESNEVGNEGQIVAVMPSTSIKIDPQVNTGELLESTNCNSQTSLSRQKSHSLGGDATTNVSVLSKTKAPNIIGLQPLTPQVFQPRSQDLQHKQSTNQTTSSQIASFQQKCSGGSITADTESSKNVAKKTVFDDLLSCQFCERLVVYSSLRKHEDQCCGLSTVDRGFCLTCKQYFGDKARLARHGLIHIQEGLPICLFCNNRHIRPTHPKSTTPSAHENLYALKKHLYSNHTSKIVQFPFKCTICSTSCADKRACEFHIKDHQFKFQINSNDRDPSPIDVSSEDLQNMVKVRRKGADPRKKTISKTIEVYYCPVCKNREFALESGLSRHLKLVHQKNPKSLDLTLLKKESTARRFVVKAPLTASHILGMHHPNTKQLGKSVASNVASLVTSLVPNSSQKARAVICPVSTSTGGNNTVTVSSSSSSNSFTSRFTSSIVLRKRLTSAATVSAAGRKLTPGGGTLSLPQLPNTRQRTNLISTAPSTAKSSPASKPSNTHPSSNFLQTRSSLSSTPVKSCRKKDGTIICLKCPEFLCKSENEFCDHVKWKHIWPDSEIDKLKFGNKLEELSEFWCPECNSMFVAKPSLVRHLKFAHDYISSVEEYMQKIGYDGKKPLKPHQCDVCYYQCADDRAHQQHIRTHGMAFLRLRQQRQLMKSQK